jgi:hypothetical protein
MSRSVYQACGLFPGAGYSRLRRYVAYCVVSGDFGRPQATTYDPIHLCLLPFAPLLSGSWDVWAGRQGPTASCRTTSH